MKDNIILIGFMGCGKTSVGKRLAEKMNYEFIDTDCLIEEKMNTSISDIFLKEGEEYFRDLETEVILQLLETTNHCVISTGGGLPLRKANTEILRELGLVIYLTATKETTVSRVRNDSNRPILAGENLDEKVEKLLMIREPRYQVAAHSKISTDHKAYSDIIDEILEYFKKYEK